VPDPIDEGMITSGKGESRQNRLGDRFCVADNTDCHRLRQPDPIRVDVYFDDPGRLGPIVQRVSRNR
jgi:hypothetical protein